MQYKSNFKKWRLANILKIKIKLKRKEKKRKLKNDIVSADTGKKITLYRLFKSLNPNK